MDEDRIIALLIESKLSVQYCVLYETHDLRGRLK